MCGGCYGQLLGPIGDFLGSSLALGCPGDDHLDCHDMGHKLVVFSQANAYWYTHAAHFFQKCDT